MSGRWAWDLESNGLLERPDLKLHCAAAMEIDTGESRHFIGHKEIRLGLLPLLESAELHFGHNITGFDLPALERISPGWRPPLRNMVDTFLVSRMQWLAALVSFSARIRNARGATPEEREAAFPAKLLRAHSLKAWGIRLGLFKGTLIADEGVFEEYDARLLAYCTRDVAVAARLFRFLLTEPVQRGDIPRDTGKAKPGRKPWKTKAALEDMPPPALRAMQVESECGYYVARMERNGIGFDRAGALALMADLAPLREVTRAELQRRVPPWWVAVEEFTPKRPNRTRGYATGCPMTKIELVEFNPGSREQIADRLQKLYGWAPTEFTDTGQPTVSEEVLASLSYPIVPALVKYLNLEKKLGMLAEGRNGWIRLERDGRIHGRVNVTGTRTGRMSHEKPNMAQVDTDPRMRALFHPTRPGWVQVGADAAGIELRMFGHRAAYFDGGEFAKTVVEGDVHAEWARLMGTRVRTIQKNKGYGRLYGAGDKKHGQQSLEDWRLAHTLYCACSGGRDGHHGPGDPCKAPHCDCTGWRPLEPEPPPVWNEAALRAVGRREWEAVMGRVAGLERIYRSCDAAFYRGWMRLLDGRCVVVEARHKAPNDMAQGDAAVCMKWAVVLLCRELAARAWEHGRDYALMAIVHDELQAECPPARGEELGKLMVEAIRRAGLELGLRLPLDGAYKVGKTWAEVH